MIDHVLNLIDSQTAFVQGLIATAVFAFASWLFRYIKRKIQKAGGEFLSVYERQEVAKHWLHKNYVRSNNAVLANHGISFVALQAFRYCLLAVLLIILFYGVNCILTGNWFFLAASWFSFNLFLEAYTWVRDSSDPKRLENISQEIKDAFYASLPPDAPESTNTQSIGNTNNQIQPTADAAAD